MTTMPQPETPTNSYTCTYDGWNRLVEVWQDDGGGSPDGTLVKTGEDADTLLGEYRYDGLHRRTAKLEKPGRFPILV